MITIGYMFIAFLAAACLVYAAQAYLKQPNNMLLLILCFWSQHISVTQHIG